MCSPYRVNTLTGKHSIEGRHLTLLSRPHAIDFPFPGVPALPLARPPGREPLRRNPSWEEDSLKVHRHISNSAKEHIDFRGRMWIPCYQFFQHNFLSRSSTHFFFIQKLSSQ
ncbi:cryptochrome-1, partial [Striga asiatica]